MYMIYIRHTHTRIIYIYIYIHNIHILPPSMKSFSPVLAIILGDHFRILEVFTLDVLVSCGKWSCSRMMFFKG